VGVTSNLPARVAQHREATHDGFTKTHDVKRLVWYELTEDMPAAIASGKRIKKWPRDRKKNLIERENLLGKIGRSGLVSGRWPGRPVDPGTSPG